MSGTLKVGGKTIATHDTNTNVSTLTADEVNLGSDGLVVDISGNVGVGTSSPTQAGLVISKSVTSGTRLALKSNETSVDTYLRIGRFGTGDDAYFAIGNNYDRPSGYAADYSSHGVTNIGFDDGYLTFGTGAAGQNNPTERMRIDTSGALLIQKEDFSSTGVSNNAGVSIDQSQGTNIPLISVSGDSASFGDVGYSLYSNNVSAYQFYVSYDGEVNYKSLNSLSDIRNKQNISNLDIGLQEVLRLAPKSFQWLNSEENSYNFGFIAQEVNDVIPSIVNERKYNDDETRFGINIDQLIPILTKAMQEQQFIIESQQSQIDSLTARIEALETPAE